MTGSLASILGGPAANDDLKSWTGSDAGLMQSRVEAARARSLAWLLSMQAAGMPRGVFRISAAHDPALWPGMLLPASASGVLCLKLFGEIIHFRGEDRIELVAWFERSRRPDGLFSIAGMRGEDIYKRADQAETWRYIGLQITAQALAAIEALDPLRKPRLEFADPWSDAVILKAWLADRDLRDPLTEGVNINTLGAFLIQRQRSGPYDEKRDAKAGLALMFDWLDRYQDPSSGFWGVGQGQSATRMLQAMAGGAEIFQLYHATRRALPFQNKAVDFALSLSPPKVHGAAVDLALVSLLVHAASLSEHRRAAIDQWLAKMLDTLLDYQNQDGGFPDARTGVWRQDGWLKGYEEKQGASNITAAFQRWQAIALIADRLWPGWKVWGFRRTAGPGFRAEAAR
jgi:hypothetical protein